MSRSWVRMSGALAPPWTRLTLVHSPAHLWRLWPASVASIATSRPLDLQIKHSNSTGPDSSRESRSTALEALH